MKTVKISQSLIKDCLRGICKHYYKLKYVEEVEHEIPTNWEAGRYFESELIGAARGGKFTPSAKKNGEKYAWVVAVDETIAFAKEMCKHNNIVFNNVQKCAETATLIGHLDAENNDAIIDVKYTAMTFGMWNKEFIYQTKHDFEIQANHYQRIIFDLTGEKKPVKFLIFSSHKWFRCIEIPYLDEKQEEHTEKIQATYLELENMQSPSMLKCASCRYSDICKNKTLDIQVENFYDL